MVIVQTVYSRKKHMFQIQLLPIELYTVKQMEELGTQVKNVITHRAQMYILLLDTIIVRTPFLTMIYVCTRNMIVV